MEQKRYCYASSSLTKSCSSSFRCLNSKFFTRHSTLVSSSSLAPFVNSLSHQCVSSSHSSARFRVESSFMGSSADEDYEAFLKKVERTVYVDNLSPLVTEAVIKAAFNQFGTVISVQFIENYLEPKSMPQAALVEMDSKLTAEQLISGMATYPFMISGMPRPVRGLPARIEMFDQRPKKPGRKIFCQWLDPKDPAFVVAQKIKSLVKRQAAETSFLVKQHLLEEEKLHNQQNEALKSHYKKFELIDKAFEDGSVKRLGHRYGINIAESGANNFHDT